MRNYGDRAEVGAACSLKKLFEPGRKSRARIPVNVSGHIKNANSRASASGRAVKSASAAQTFSTFFLMHKYFFYYFFFLNWLSVDVPLRRGRMNWRQVTFFFGVSWNSWAPTSSGEFQSRNANSSTIVLRLLCARRSLWPRPHSNGDYGNRRKCSSAIKTSPNEKRYIISSSLKGAHEANSCFSVRIEFSQLN